MTLLNKVTAGLKRAHKLADDKERLLTTQVVIMMVGVRASRLANGKCSGDGALVV